MSLNDFAVRLYGPCPLDPDCRLADGHGGEHEPLCGAKRKPWSTCTLAAGHEGDHAWGYENSHPRRTERSE